MGGVQKRTFLLLSIFFFIIALFLPCYSTGKTSGDLFQGFGLLTFGWIGVLGFYIYWLANPLLFISWILFNKKPKVSLYFSIMAIVVMVSFVYQKEILINEAGHISKITGYSIGYYLWILSALIAIIGNFKKPIEIGG